MLTDKIPIIKTYLGPALVTGVLTNKDFSELEQAIKTSNEADEDFYVSVLDCAKRIAVHPLTIKRAIKAGDIDAIKLTREWRVSQYSFLKYIEDRKLNK